MKKRIYFLDHLRTFAIFLVVLLHAGIVYEPILEKAWIVSDPDKSGAIGLVRMYLDLFVMYTIFFVAGYFMHDSVNRKTAAEVLRSKFKRILLPWLIAVFTLIPAYKVIFLYARGWPQEAWYSYFHIYQRAGSDLEVFSNNPSQNWLWFLPVLFLFQVVYLAFAKTGLFPLRISLRTGVWLVLLLGIGYSMAISLFGLTGWQHSGFLEFQRERLLPYFLVFGLGALSREKRVFTQEKNTRLYIWANVVLTLSLGVFTAVALNLFFNLIEPGRNYFFVSSVVDRTVYYFTALLSMLSFLYVLLYVFRSNFHKTNRLWMLLNRQSYAVYIIHVIVLGVLALALRPLPLPVWVKYLLLTVLTFAVSNALVYAYRRVFWQRVYLKVAGLASLFLVFLLVTGAGNAEAPAGQRAAPTALTSELPATDIGLHEAVIKGDVEAVRRHIKAGADLNEREPTGGSTPLITAAVFGRSQIARLLIDAGADLNLRNNEGSTALISAAFFGREEMVEVLLTAGADRSLRNKSGSTALDAVTPPFEAVKSLYDYYRSSLGPLGLELDYQQLREARPRIAERLRR